MKRLFLTLFLLFAVIVTSATQQPKYIFYFIGDGMGLNIINATEVSLAAKEGKIGNNRLSFTQFPVLGIATTYSATRYITDSAAAGTALASGHKTYPGAIGTDVDQHRRLESVALDAKRDGKAVGVISSVSIDHATPASFFAWKPSRKMYHEISKDAAESMFDLYGGSGFLEPIKDGVDVLAELAKVGYTHIKGKEMLSKVVDPAKRYVITERDGAAVDAFAYRIDRTSESLSLPTMLKTSIDYLEKRGGESGFFVMAEGGMIDWAAHNNDAVAAIGEVIDLDEAVEVAMEFYRRYPTQTLIVVTADHETGGFGLGNTANQYDLHLDVAECQKVSQEELKRAILAVKNDWDSVNNIIQEKMGFGSGIELSELEWSGLREVYDTKPSMLAEAAVALLNRKSGFGWTSNTHTGSPVMIYSIGVGSEQFAGYHDNTDIPNIIRRLMK